MPKTAYSLIQMVMGLVKDKKPPPFRADEVPDEYLMTSDDVPFSAKVTLQVKSAGTVVEQINGVNLMPTEGRTAVGDALIDGAAQFDTGITYCAVGTSDTDPALSDSQLGAEVHRETVTAKSRSGVVITISTDFAAADVAVAIEEVGLFGTSSAGAGVNSGVLFGRALASYDNSAGTYDITVIYRISIG